MTTALMLLWLSYSKIEQKDMPLQTHPEVICPNNMDEYLLRYKSWARKEIRNNQIKWRNQEIIKDKI